MNTCLIQSARVRYNIQIYAIPAVSIVKQIIEFHVCILHLFRSSRQISHLLVLHNNCDGSCAYTYRKQMSMRITKDICIAKYIIIQICNKIILYPLQANK